MPVQRALWSKRGGVALQPAGMAFSMRVGNSCSWQPTAQFDNLK